MPKIPLTTVTRAPGLLRGKDSDSVYNEKVTLYAEVDASVAAGSHVIDIDVPIGFVGEVVYVRTTSTSVIATGTVLGVGPVAATEKYGEIAHTSMDAIGDDFHIMCPANDPTTAVSQIAINSTNGSGSVTGTISGKFVIKLTGTVYNTIAE